MRQPSRTHTPPLRSCDGVALAMLFSLRCLQCDRSPALHSTASVLLLLHLGPPARLCIGVRVPRELLSFRQQQHLWSPARPRTQTRKCTAGWRWKEPGRRRRRQIGRGAQSLSLGATIGLSIFSRTICILRVYIDGDGIKAHAHADYMGPSTFNSSRNSLL